MPEAPESAGDGIIPRFPRSLERGGALGERPVRLFEVLSKVVYAPPGYLLYVARSGKAAGSNRYDVTRDGRRFLFSMAAAAPSNPQMTMVLNWTAKVND